MSALSDSFFTITKLILRWLLHQMNEITAALLYIMIRNIHIRLVNGLTYHTSHFKTMK